MTDYLSDKYNKWSKIEVSDDEDDTHPNVDTGSLFRWRHQARMERMQETEEKLKSVEEAFEKARKLRVERQNQYESDKSNENYKFLFDEAAKAEKEAKDKLDEILQEQKKQPWNVDTISKPGFSKSIINKDAKPKSQNMTEEEKQEYYEKFIKENEANIKKFAFYKNYDDSKDFLQKHPDLVCEETANYLVLMCLNLEMEEKSALMEHVAHQAIVMQFILELAKQLDRDPRSCAGAFFHRIKQAEKQYIDAFNDEYEAFKERIRTRAKVRLEEALKAAEEEERQARLGPGGLDPLEVMEELPEELRECFESRDLSKLKEVLAKLDKDVAIDCMDKCVKSGLWVPDASAAQEGDENTAATTGDS